MSAPEERYLEWLLREEDAFGVELMTEATLSEEHARRVLKDELGIDATDSRVKALHDTAVNRYVENPTIGVRYEGVMHPSQAFMQYSYRDVITGRFTSKVDVEAALFAMKQG